MTSCVGERIRKWRRINVYWNKTTFNNVSNIFYCRKEGQLILLDVQNIHNMSNVQRFRNIWKSNRKMMDKILIKIRKVFKDKLDTI